MRAEGLVAAQPRLKVRTTIPADDVDGRPDLVERDFTADEPGQKWVGDITYIHTLEGFCYLATVLDCCTKKAVGYAIDDHMRTELMSGAIDMAVRNCEHVRGETIFHSDHGSQYMSKEFTELLESYDIRPSVGRTGVCWDNAWAESFNATLKNERVHRVIYRTKEEAARDVVRWIELRYNQKRLHSALGYRTPNEVEAEYRESRQVA
jgi:transposase InsO family protein